MIATQAGNELDFNEFFKTIRNYPHDQATLRAFWKATKLMKACLLIRRTGPCIGQIIIFSKDDLPKLALNQRVKELRKGNLFCALPKEVNLVYSEHFVTKEDQSVAQASIADSKKRGRRESRVKISTAV